MVIKRSNLRRPTVPLGSGPARPSRIRREPVRPDMIITKKIDWTSREWEVRLAIAGIVFFALAICAVVIDLCELIVR